MWIILSFCGRPTGEPEARRGRVTGSRLHTRFPTKLHLVWLRNLTPSSARVDKGHSPTAISWMFSCAHTHRQQKAVMIELYPDDKPGSFITHQPAPRSTCTLVPIYGAGMWTCCCCCRFGPHHLDLNHKSQPFIWAPGRQLGRRERAREVCPLLLKLITTIQLLCHVWSGERSNEGSALCLEQDI